MTDFIWILIILVSFVLTVGSLFLLRAFEESEKTDAAQSRRLIRRGGMVCLAVAFLAMLYFGIRHPMNLLMIPLHYCGFLVVAILADGIRELARKGKRENKAAGSRIAGLLGAFLGCLFYLGVGLLAANLVRRTAYNITTEKKLPCEELCVVQISDVHLGTTMDNGDLEALVKRILAEKPDIVAVTGDFTDSGTSREMMLRGCEALGKLAAECEVYFVDGNHDVPDGDAAFTLEELQAALTAQNVRVLNDEAVLAKGGVCVIGRRDRTEKHLSMAQLTKDINPELYTIVLDHQPDEFDEESGAGVDLVLCGHLHGGYILPLRWFAPLLTGMIGEADRIYGREERGSTVFVVNSGAGTWGIDFKTGAFSEYVVIRIKNQ